MFKILNCCDTLEKKEIVRLMEPFYRLEKSRNKLYGGTGLGLAIVNRILQLHNSNFGIDFIDTQFIFYFDLNKINNDFE